MATITLRQTKGSPLTFQEMDNNLTNLNNDKLEQINNLNVASTLDLNTDYIAIYDASQGDSRKILANAVPFLNRTLVIKAIADGLPTYVADGVARIVLPSNFDQLVLDKVGAHVYTTATGSTTIVQIHNETRGVDMLSTPILIDAGENDTNTSAQPPVINPSNERVYNGDVLRFDIDQIGSSTAALGLELRLEFDV
jgi:hypothetical protein